MKGGIGFKKVKCYEVDYLIDLRMIKPEQTLNDFDRDRFFASQIKGVLLIVNTAKENSLTDEKEKKRCDCTILQSEKYSSTADIYHRN